MGSLSPGAQRVCPAPGVEREGVDRRGQWAVGGGGGRGAGAEDFWEARKIFNHA